MSTPVSPEIAGEVVKIDPALIDPDDAGRIGQFFPLKAEGLACRIAVDGQLEPITVVRTGNRAKLPWKLVFGRHRLAACLQLGRAVEARVVTGTKDQLRKMQASENLDRRRMTVLEEAMFVAAVADVAQARIAAKHGGATPQQLGGMAKAARSNLDRAEGGIREDGEIHFLHPGSASDEIAAADGAAEAALDHLSSAYGWREEVREAVGMSLSSVKRALRIHRQLVVPFPDLMDALKDHQVADNASALLKLAAIGKDGREEELRALANGEASATPAPEPVEPKVKLYNRAVSTLSRMAASEHDALIEARVKDLSIGSKRRIFKALQADLGREGD